MPHIDDKVVIRADMPRVFDLVSHPTKFARCSKHIVQVVPLGNKQHHWDVKVAGIILGWDSVIIRYKKPEHFAWRSITGVESAGSYTLAPTQQGTVVTFEMDYLSPSKLLDKVATPLLEPLIHAAVREVLECIKELLENETESDRCSSINKDEGRGKVT